MKQEVQLIIRITAEVDASHSREQLIKTANSQISMLSTLIQKPIELIALREEADIYGHGEMTCEQLLRIIAATPLWADTLPDSELRNTAIEAGEYDVDEDHYTPSNDTETNHLRDVVEMARELIAKIDKTGVSHG